MDNNKSFEAIIGGLILLICGLFFTHIMKSNSFVKKEKYNHILYAKFNNIEGIKIGTEVKIAGIRVGAVEKTEIDPSTFQVKVKLNIADNLKLPTDSSLNVSSSGLLGGKYLEIKPGMEDSVLKNGEYFSNTTSSLNIEDLINKVVASFSK